MGGMILNYCLAQIVDWIFSRYRPEPKFFFGGCAEVSKWYLMVLQRCVFGRENGAPGGRESHLKFGRENNSLRPKKPSRYRRELSLNGTNKYIQMAPDGNSYDFPLHMQARIWFEGNKTLNAL